MSDQVYHIEVEEESDLNHRFFHTNKSTGLPIDLTGYRAEMQVRYNYEGIDNPNPALIYTSELGGGIVLGGTAGTVDLFIAYSDTKDKWWNKANYSLTLISPMGARIKFVKGFFTILKDSTKISNSVLPDISPSVPGYTEPNNLNTAGLNKPV